MAADQSIEAMRRAVQTVFPLYEVGKGRQYRITHFPEPVLPIEDYLGLQGRFNPVLDDPDLLASIREEIDERWDWLIEQDARRSAFERDALCARSADPD